MHRLQRRAATWAVLALAVIAVLTACGGSKSARPTATLSAFSVTPGASATPAPPPTPTPAAADASAGDRLRAEGDFTAAADVYAAIAAQSDGDKRQAARLAQAQLLARAGRAEDARVVLVAYLADGGAAADASVARYMLASALDDLGDAFGALDSYERYIAAGGAAAAFARIERAKLLARLGGSVDAVLAADAVLASDVLPEFKASFTLSMGKAFEQGKDDIDALAWYGRAATIAGGDVASALARSGAVKKRLGDATWSADYRRAITSYPSSGVAPDLLDALDAAVVPVGDYARGVVEYRAFRNAAARASLTRAAAAAA